MRVPFDNSYTSLPEHMFVRTTPAAPPHPALIRLNEPLAVQLGLDPKWLAADAGLDFLSGREIVEGSDPIAQAYAGHQFGNFVPQLGDGRAILLGELVDRAGRRFDVQLKGAGRTPFSRGGDGRAALGPVLREYIVSEAMAALNIPTTRSLAALTTGEDVYREAVLPGALLVRVASSHIRVGTFQFFAARGDTRALRALAAHVIARHYPNSMDHEEPILALLQGVIERQADLVANWLLVGFVHGVMNTDNCSIAGETIDYGPCAFLDEYDPAKVFSSIDRVGRYAYGNQPRIAQWNLARLAETLLPLLAQDEKAAVAKAQEALAGFEARFRQAYEHGLRCKFGLSTAQDDDIDLATGILDAMQAGDVDFTQFFRKLCRAAEGDDAPARDLFPDPTVFDRWVVAWRQRIAQERGPGSGRALMERVNPAYIPRNHQIEAVIRAAVTEEDFAPFDKLLEVIARPYEARSDLASFAEPPLGHERVTATYCGT